MKKLCKFIFFLVIVAAGTAFGGYQQLQQFAAQTVNVQQDQLLTVERGTSTNKLVTLLEQEKILDNAALLPWLIKLNPELSQFKAGTYSLNGVHTVTDLLKVLNEGKEAQFSLRFTEGETVKQVLKSLENAPHLKREVKDESAVFTLIQPLLPEIKTLNELQKPEGWIYPDTYNYTPNSTDTALLKRAAERMVKTLDKAWAERDKDLPLNNPYEMLILASIVEKETGIAAERGKVASVFINRLKLKMKLQTDPTVIYGMGDSYDGNIRKKDLEQPTAYNTYVIDGLPLTPIAAPSEGALMAVAKPEKTNFLYFVADGTGGHKFSTNINDHNRAVQEYLRWYRSNQKGK